MALFVVLVAYAAVMYERGRIPLFQKTSAVDAADPFLDRTDADVDYGDPAVNGLITSNPRRDAAKLLGETKKMDIRFRKSVNTFKEQGRNAEARTLTERDKFAARRLKLLRALENAKTPEDRRKIIESLKNLSLKTD